ncbi:MAG TPA: 2-amino-4-hydroxy-6-hydroxymethyldihydropteridine diphosphokinase [bacterium]|nr:2-amino-4-hydroxy-6-hydroxymethyldihydropteridine diphosphokinase [bacterium]
MSIVFIGYGSNLRGRLQWIERGLEMLEDALGPARKSPVYETNPVGEGLTRWFLNGVWMFQTERSPHEVHRILRDAEIACGRIASVSPLAGDACTTKPQYQDRTLDLDLLLYDQLILDEDNLIVPHPRMHLRKFVLKPLADLAPLTVHPLLKSTVSQLLREGDFEGQEIRSYP